MGFGKSASAESMVYETTILMDFIKKEIVFFLNTLNSG